MRSYAFRVDVVRNGATFTSLTPVGFPSVDMNESGAIKMSMSGQFLWDDRVEWLSDELCPVQTIDGVDYPVGLFPVGTVAESFDENGLHTVKVDAYDRCLVLQNHKTETVLHFAAGERYLNVIQELLFSAGIELHFTVDSDKVLATDREDWDVGTPFLTIINQLLSEINYGSIWFNHMGYAMIEPEVFPDASEIDHHLGAEQSIRVLRRPCSVELDAFDVPNVFVVVCSNPDLPQPLISTAVNDNPLSALSTVKRGRRVVGVTQVNNVPDQDALDEYAGNLKLQSMMASETVSVSTINLPGHGVRDVVALMHPDIQGIYLEVGWSMELGREQRMTHNLRRLVLV